MRLQSPWRLVGGVVAALLIAFCAYAGWLVWQVNNSLSAAADDARALKAAVEAGDDAAIDRSFGALQQHAADSRGHTDSPVWGLLTHVPWFGDDADGVRIVSRVVDDLGNGALADLAHRVGDLDSIVPAKGGIDLRAVAALQQPISDGHRALAAAQRRLDSVDSSGYVERLKLKYRDLQRQVREASSALGVADDAVSAMPTMLGADGAQRYLLVVQNNAEIRATGGLPGAVSLVEARRGRLSLIRQVAGGEFGRADKPVLPLTPVESKLYSEILGTFFVDANMTPDFPRAADLWRARWRQVEGSDIDGVISLDPVALSYLLRATGPVTVDGDQLTAANVVDRLLHEVYLDFPDPRDQDSYFRQVAQAVFAKLTQGTPAAKDLVSALRQGASERRILLHSFDDKLQQTFAGKAIAGELTAKTDGPQVGVYLNDATGAKMSYYLRYQVRSRATSCSNGVQTITSTMTLTSTAPADAGKTLPAYITGDGQFDVDPGTQLLSVQIFGPLGGSIDELEANGKPDDFQQDIAGADRPIKQTWVGLEPGQTVDLSWTMKSGKGQTGDLEVSATPTITPGSASSVTRSAC